MLTDKEIRDRILFLFEDFRTKRGSYFDEAHFLDYLTFPPHRHDGIKNSFRGVKRYYRFMDKVELEFGICFSLSHLDRLYSVDALVKKVQERLEKDKGNKTILKHRKQYKDSNLIYVILGVILLVFYMWMGIHWATVVVTLIIARVVYWVFAARNYEREHIKKLEKKILNPNE